MNISDGKGQAVIIIHGIGEQEPMQTLRGFATSIIPDINPLDDPLHVKEKFYVKQDALSQLFDLRRITVPQDKKKTRIKTDFYEYYWAHQIRDTQLSDVLSWIGGVFLKGKYVPRRLKGLHTILLLLVILIPFAVVALLYFFPSIRTHWVDFAAAGAGIVYLVANLIRHFINSVSVNFIGDAARYFTPKPGNIINRQQIRKEGLDLLQKLHNEHLGDAAKTPRYSRIIVVSHSLGSVVAYDLLSLLWANYHSTLTKNDTKQQAKLKEMQDKVIELSKKPATEQLTDKELAEFKQLQAELLEASAAAGNPWRITDLITLGSPLSHAQLLMAKGKQALEQMQKERQFPTCPPVLEAQQVISFGQKFDFEKKKLKVPHHAALFAFTQWTNLWYENDYVGGPMNDSFGKCITDEQLVSKTNPKIPFMSHTHYWDKRETESVKLIRDIIFKN